MNATQWRIQRDLRTCTPLSFQFLSFSFGFLLNSGKIIGLCPKPRGWCAPPPPPALLRNPWYHWYCKWKWIKYKAFLAKLQNCRWNNQADVIVKNQTIGFLENSSLWIATNLFRPVLSDRLISFIQQFKLETMLNRRAGKGRRKSVWIRFSAYLHDAVSIYWTITDHDIMTCKCKKTLQGFSPQF